MEKYVNKRIDFNAEIYTFIVSYFKQNMLVPTIREIIEGTGYKSSQTVHMHIKRLLKDRKLNQIGDRYCLPKDKVIEIVRELDRGTK